MGRERLGILMVFVYVMKILFGFILIGVLVLMFFLGCQNGILMERNSRQVYLLKGDSKMKFLDVTDFEIFQSIASGRMKTFILIRGDLDIKNTSTNQGDFFVKNQNDFSDRIKTFYGIEDEFLTERIAPNRGRWLSGHLQDGRQIIYSPENSIVFTEMVDAPKLNPRAKMNPRANQ